MGTTPDTSQNQSLGPTTADEHITDYNALVERQLALTEGLDQAVRTIVDNMKVKVALAHRQDKLHGELGCAYPNLSPVGIRHAILEEITRRLQWDVPSTGPLSLRDIDWSCKRMSAGRVLE